jgi:hypothetical protein
MDTDHSRQRKPPEHLVLMFEQSHLECRSAITAWRFEEHRSAVLLAATAIKREPFVA